MPVVARIEVPPPEPFVEGEGGAEAHGAGYRFIAPRTATEPLVMEAADGSAFLWTPTELCYRDEFGQIDFIAGSAPVQLEVRGREARYRRTFPASDEVHIAQPEGRKYWLILHERPRDPAHHLQGEIWFGVSGMVGGIPLPPGIHRTMESFGFQFKAPFAADLMDAQTECWYEVVDTENGQMLFIWCRATWLLDPDRVYPVKLDPTIIVVATSYLANVHAITRTSKGVLWAILHGTPSRTYLYRSADGGQTWVQDTGWNEQIFDEGLGSGSVHAIDNVLHITYRSGWYMAYNWAQLNDDHTTIVATGTRVLTETSSSRGISVAYKHGSKVRIALLHEGYYGSTLNRVRLTEFVYENGQSQRVRTIDLGSAYDNMLIPELSIAVNSAGQVRGLFNVPGGYVYSPRFDLSSGGYSLGDAGQITGTTPRAPFSIAADANGRFIRAHIQYQGRLQVYRTNASGGWDNLNPPEITNPTSLKVATSGNDVYLFYTLNGLKLIWRDEATGAWSASETLDANSTCKLLSVSPHDNGFDVLYTTTSGSNLTVHYLAYNFNTPPLAPSDLNRGPFDASLDAVFTWKHNDPDPGDGQASYHLQIRLNGSDTNLVDTGQVDSPHSQYLLPANTLENGKVYQWRVRTADQAGEWSPWSDWAVFQTGPKPVATILYPTAGATVSTSEVTVEWSVPSQSSATVRLYDGTGQTVLQEHEVTTPSARQRTITGLENNQSYQVSVQPVSSIGVVGDEVFSGPFTVQYTPPPKPTATATSQEGFVRISIVNPPPTGDQPDVASNEVWRREPGKDWVRVATGIAPDGTYDDYAVGSGVVYEYRARAVGANGTYTDSDPAQATVTFEEWRFSPVDGRPEIRFRFDSSVDWNPEEDVQVPATMSRYRRVYRNPAFPRVANIQARFKDGEDGLTVREQRERLLSYIQQGVVGWLRGPHGDVWRGVLMQPQVQPSAHFAREAVSCVFRETREAP